MRFAIDTGGTFTDLAVEDETGRLHQFKAPTTPGRSGARACSTCSTRPQATLPSREANFSAAARC